MHHLHFTESLLKQPLFATFEPAKAAQEFKSEIKSKDEEIEELQKQLGKSVVEKEWLAKLADAVFACEKVSLKKARELGLIK